MAWVGRCALNCRLGTHLKYYLALVPIARSLGASLSVGGKAMPFLIIPLLFHMDYQHVHPFSFFGGPPEK